MKRAILPIIVVILSLLGLAPAETRLVPDEYATIQAAIDAAVDGDVVVIAPGTYTGEGNRDIDFNGKAITVRSVDPNDPTTVAATIIDCQASYSDLHRGFYFWRSSVRADSVIDGLTITNGYRWKGGGIDCDGYSSPKIVRCRIVGNSGAVGVGIHVLWGTPIIDRCVIMNNSVGPEYYSGEGGGIHSQSRTGLTISNCIIAGNSVIGTSHSYRGGGLSLINEATLRNCTITGNAAIFVGGILCNKDANIIIENCIVWGNTSADSLQIGGNPTVSYSDIQGGFPGIGNIDANPLFVNPGAGDFHLSSSSPCIDAGDPYFLPFPSERDIDGEPRVMGMRTDMGGDEFTSTFTPIIGISPTSITFHASQGGPNPKEEVLSIHSAGYSNLIWNISHDCPWLNVKPTQGESSDEFDPVSLSADTRELDFGEHTCELTITAIGASNSPLKVPLTLYIRPIDGILEVPSEYATIQSAINATQNGDTVIAAPMIYTGDFNRDIDFCGKAITVRSVNPNDPNVVEATIINCEGLGRGFNFHSGENTNSVLAGFTITNGSADKGCAIYINNSSPSIRRCAITGNSSDEREVEGCGIYIRDGNPIISHCKISENSIGNTRTYGGGIYCTNSNPIITHCIITNNYVRDKGGGIYCGGCEPLISHCIIKGNVASFREGGGICSYSSIPIITNCLITGNSSREGGGGISLTGNSGVVDRCSILGNDVGIYILGDKTIITNSILWNNRAQIWFYRHCGPPPPALEGMVTNSAQEYVPELTVLYSDIQEGPNGVHLSPCPLVVNWGPGNIDADPCFVSPGYWQSSQVWIDGDYHLLETSPCINAGDPNITYNWSEKDLDGKLRVMGRRIDMGAYEYILSIPVEVRFVPRTINLKSKGNWITAFLWIPENYNVADIDSKSIFLNGKIQAESVHIYEKEQVAMARFGREDVQSILKTGEVELTISALLTNGTIIEGTDAIRVIYTSGGRFAEPGKPSNPNPADGAIGVSTTTDLSWTAGSDATLHFVYFGTSNPPPFVCNQTSTTFEPGMMDYGTTYYWRIDEANKWGTAYGEVWNFTTTQIPPPPIPAPPPPAPAPKSS